MNVTETGQIEKVVQYLKKAAEKETDPQQASALINVCCVLEQAMEMHQEDAGHPHVYLKIVDSPNPLDQAVSVCCTVDCIHVRQGTCTFRTADKKHKCQTIEGFLYDKEEYD